VSNLKVEFNYSTIQGERDYTGEEGGKGKVKGVTQGRG